MGQVRMLYRGCKVWVDADEAGRLAVERGLAKIRYRREDKASYSAKESELSAVPAEAAPAPERAEEPAPESTGTAAASAKKTPRAPRKPRGKAPAAAGTAARGAAKGRAGRVVEMLVIYADGSCFGNPGPAGVGVLLEWKGQTKEISQFLGEGTNNIAELTAIEVALQQVKNRSVPIRIHTDSQYSIGVLTEGWKVKANQELVRRIQALIAEFPDVALVKVRGHAGDPRNERVDQLARDAILKSGRGSGEARSPLT